LSELFERSLFWCFARRRANSHIGIRTSMDAQLPKHLLIQPQGFDQIAHETPAGGWDAGRAA